MAAKQSKTVRDILLTTRGLAFVATGTNELPQECVRAVELELAAIGYVVSGRLRDRLSTCSLDELASFRDSMLRALLEHVGGNQKHEPLFRRFPYGVPDNTEILWWRKVLVHFLQAEGQPCLFCGRSGTTHVLNPCRHVVCDHCFDGANYSACPSCEHHVDRSSPFFLPTPDRATPSETVIFKLLALGESEEQEARKLFVALCERKQALSPADREALVCIVRAYNAGIVEWLPEKIPVRENVAVVLGTLFQECDGAEVMPVARRFMTTATDVLRFIAVFSGTDGSLLRETVFKTIDRTAAASHFWTRIAKLIGAMPPAAYQKTITIPMRVNRFKVARMSRALRRTLLSLLEEMDQDRITEDMLRHRSYWVWVGEFLHPYEYAAKFPKVAGAFQVVRKRAIDGTRSPRFRGWYSRLEKAVKDKNVDGLLATLSERPGEFARRLDLALRAAEVDDSAIENVVKACVRNIPSFANPVLLTLRSHLPRRLKRAEVRVFWPKGRIAKGVSSADERATLPSAAVATLVQAIDAELIGRFSHKPPFAQCIIDEELRTVTVPFNERTASQAAVVLPRGSSIPVPFEKTMRLFLHWCQPAKGGRTTDLDLSVALYDEAWQYVGVCSYYQLRLAGKTGQLIAQSAGDLRDAPWPDGATEFVDLSCEPAVANGARYAVMVVNSFAGMPFSQLERGFAGLMIRSDTGGQHFDPRTVELKFALNGENGVFLPLVIDMHTRRLLWLDVQSKGQFEFNNVETSKSAIAKLCPELMTYFASGVRPTMYELAILHAAARCESVIIRGSELKTYQRNPGEKTMAFYERLLSGQANGQGSNLTLDSEPALAILFRGDIEVPEGSAIYAIFRDQLVPTIAASDLLS
jgi:hypothetical protein